MSDITDLHQFGVFAVFWKVKAKLTLFTGVNFIARMKLL